MSKRAFRSQSNERSEGETSAPPRSRADYPIHTVGRRAFLQRLGLIAAGGVAGSLLVGCGDDPEALGGTPRQPDFRVPDQGTAPMPPDFHIVDGLPSQPDIQDAAPMPPDIIADGLPSQPDVAVDGPTPDLGPPDLTVIVDGLPPQPSIDGGGDKGNP